MQHIRIALVGKPNVGKTSLINSITGAHLRVANFSGTTIEKTEVSFKRDGYLITLVDLPGIYSFYGSSKDEQIAHDFLQNHSQYDAIINIVDSTNLERCLHLTLDLIERLPKKPILAINMIDEATKEGLYIDTNIIESELQTPCVDISAKTKLNVESLINVVIREVISSNAQHINHSQKKPDNDIDHDKLFQERNERIKEILSKSIKVNPLGSYNLTHKIDKILLNKFLGLPIFFCLVWLLFSLTFKLGAIPAAWITSGSTYIGAFIGKYIGNDQLKSLFVDGLIGGVSSVLTFVPNIAILFLGISLFEKTGYMSRVAFLLDGLFRRFGLHGKSFIPLITGFGCSIPAYMSVRILPNYIDRIITFFIIGFMSCSARLTVFVLLTGAFFGAANAPAVLFIIYIGGIIIGLILAKIMRIVAFKGKEEPFLIEIPKYRLPSLKVVLRQVWSKVNSYLKKAGTLIALFSILIWVGSHYPYNSELKRKYNAQIAVATDDTIKLSLQRQLNEQQMSYSAIGTLGSFVQPIFTPLGFDWRMTISLIMGLAAKEVVIATMIVLYQADNVDSLTTIIKQNIPLSSGISFITFIMLYLPCASASVTFAKEIGSKKYLLYLFLFTTSLAWIISFIARYTSAIILN